MSKKDYLKEEIGILKEEYRNIFLIFLTVGTGSFASFYQVLLGKVPIWKKGVRHYLEALFSAYT